MPAKPEPLATARNPTNWSRLFLLLGALCLAWPAPGRAAFEVRGRVVDERGDPMARASVELSPYPRRSERCRSLLAGQIYPEPVAKVTTSADGRYLLQVPDPGIWQIYIRAEGRIPMRRVLAPLTTDRDLSDAKLRNDAGVWIEVVDSAGQAVDKAQVRAVPVEDRGPRVRTSGWRERRLFGFTDEDGRVELSRPHGASLRVTAWGAGFLPSTETTVTGGSGVVRLSQGTPVRLQFLEGGKAPVAGALVGVEGWRWIGGFTDSEGSITLAVEPGEQFEYALQHSDGATYSGSIERSALHLEQEGAPAEVVSLAPPAELREKVVQAKTGEPIGGAFVWSGRDYGHVVRTLADGTYKLRESVFGDLRIGSGAAGYQTNWAAVEGDQKEPSAPTIALSPAASLSGRVVDADGKGVASADVRATRPNHWRHPTVSSREDGSFYFEELELDETYAIAASAPGYAPSERTLKLAVGATIELELRRGRSLIGTVVDEARAAVVGAEVTLLPIVSDFRNRFRDRGRVGPEPAATDTNGAFQIDGLGDKPMALLAGAPGFADRLVTGLEMEGEERVVDAGEIVLEAGVALRGVVRSNAGSAVESAQIWINSENFTRFMIAGDAAREMGRSAVSASNGEFVIEDLSRNEPLKVIVNHEEFVRNEIDGVQPGGDDVLEIILDRAARVSGRVENEEGQPIGGASVTVDSLSEGKGLSSRADAWKLSSARDRSAQDGSFTVAGVRPGKVELRAEMKGFLTADPVQLTLAAGDDRSGALIVLQRGATFEGRVVNERAEPILGADVWVVQEKAGSSPFSRFGPKATTDADGRFEVTGLASGSAEIVLHVRHSDYVGFEERLEFQPGLEQLVVLETGSKVSGFVLTEAGDPVGGADVKLSTSNRVSRGSEPGTTSLEDGSFEISGVEAGTYQVTASKTGFATSVAEKTVEAGLTPVTGLTVYLKQGGTIRGSIRGLQPSELGQVQIIVFGEEHRQPQSFGLVDLEGEYHVANVGVTKGTVMASSPVSGRHVQEPFELGIGAGEVRIDLEFPLGSMLSGEVRLDGEPWDGAYVMASSGPAGQGAARTSREGRFKIQGLPDGRYRVAVLEHGGAQYSEMVDLSGDTEIAIDVRGVRLSGHVTDVHSGEPIAGATVLVEGDLVGLWTSGGGQAVTSASGDFELRVPVGDTLTLRAKAEGYSEASTTASTTSGDQGGFNFELEPGVALDFGARLWSGIEPQGLSIGVVDGAGKRVLAQYLRPIGGRYRVSSLPSGSWNLLVVAEGSAVVSVPIDVPGPPLDLVLPQESRIEVNLEAIAKIAGIGKLRILSTTGGQLRVPRFDRIASEWPVGGPLSALSGVPTGTWVVEYLSDTGRVWRTAVTTLPGETAEASLQ